MPTITILHGENEVLSRAELVRLVEAARSRGEVATLDGSKTTVPELHTALSSTSLFDVERTVVIERLWSHKSPTKKKALLSLVAESPVAIILWHPKKITVTQLKDVQKAKPLVTEFKASMETWKFIDNIGSGDTKSVLSSLYTSCRQDGPEYVFAQVVSRVRGLLATVSGAQVVGNPYTVQKIQSQARAFSMDQLVKMSEDLLKFDRKLKTSATLVDINQFLTNFILFHTNRNH